MKARFGRRYLFSASHRLNSDTLTAEENRATYGKCNNPHGHGHNYELEVLISGDVDADTGMVVNMVAVDEAVRKRVLERFDHVDLNRDPLFVNQVPTTENLCRAIFALLDDAFGAAKLQTVRVEETENNFFECFRAER